MSELMTPLEPFKVLMEGGGAWIDSKMPTTSFLGEQVSFFFSLEEMLPEERKTSGDKRGSTAAQRQCCSRTCLGLCIFLRISCTASNPNYLQGHRLLGIMCKIRNGICSVFWYSLHRGSILFLKTEIRYMNTQIAKSVIEAGVNLVFLFPLGPTLLLTSRVFSAGELDSLN